MLPLKALLQAPPPPQVALSFWQSLGVGAQPQWSQALLLSLHEYKDTQLDPLGPHLNQLHLQQPNIQAR